MNLQREIGGWWRFDRYTVANGWIAPAPGARLERYDPWEAYRASRERNEGSTPYQTLFTLLQKLNFDKERRLKPEGERALEQWCGRNGLLGILPQRFSIISQQGSAGEDGSSAWARSHIRKGWMWSSVPGTVGQLGALELDPQAPLVHAESNWDGGPLEAVARLYPEIFRS